MAFGKPVSTEGSGLGASYSRTGGRTWSAAWSLVVYLTPLNPLVRLEMFEFDLTSKPLKRPYPFRLAVLVLGLGVGFWLSVCALLKPSREHIYNP